MRRLFRSINPSVRILLSTFIFALLLFVFILVINRAEPIVQGRSFTLGDITSLTQSLNFEPESIALLALIPTLEVLPPAGAGYEGNLVRIRLDDLGYYVFDADPNRDVDQLCLDELRLGYDFSDPQMGQTSDVLIGVDILDGAEPMCGDLGQPVTGSEATLWIRATLQTPLNRALFDELYIELPTTNVFYRYPYDSFDLSAVAQASYRLLRGDEVLSEGVSAPFPVWVFQTDSERNWNVEVTTRAATVSAEAPYPSDFFGFLRDGDYLAADFTFDRPLLFRLTYPLLILAMIVIISLLPFVLELEPLLEITAAILFGIFGLRQVMTPPNSQGQTILDILFLALYVVLAFTLILTVTSRALAARRSAKRPPTGEGESPA